jgi:hypothetical protein
MPAIVRQPDQDSDILTTSHRSPRPEPVNDVLTERVAAIVN